MWERDDALAKHDRSSTRVGDLIVRASPGWLTAGAALGLTLGLPAAGAGQSLLDRPDNISTNWVGNTGTLYFNFVHRFQESAAPERKVTNFPTFLVATGIASQALIGFNYATNSALSSRYPNEWEFFGRYAPLQQDDGAPVDLGAQVDYNLAVKGVDGEISVARRDGPLRLVAMTRLIADTIGGDKRRVAFGGGGTLRFGRFLALAGDVASLSKRAASEKVAWSAGVHIALPNTPHTLSLHVSNATTSTLQGLSRGGSTRRYGFEFTIPVHVNRFFTNPEPTAAPELAPGAMPARDTGTTVTTPTNVAPVTSTPAQPVNPPAARPVTADTTVRDANPPRTQPAPTTPTRTTQPAPAPRQTPAASRSISARMKGQAYIPGNLEVAAGTTVTWKNQDALIHTVTAIDKSFNSGVIAADGAYSHTFSKPGTYAIYCMAHPFMKGTVVVK